jgi:hypothetical protein
MILSQYNQIIILKTSKTADFMLDQHNVSSQMSNALCHLPNLSVLCCSDSNIKNNYITLGVHGSIVG